jgi:hypothetical protein
MSTVTLPLPLIPAGFRIERVESTSGFGDRFIKFSAYEPGVTYKNSEVPRSSIDVELTIVMERYGKSGEPEISWPSTSDKRPALAKALAVMLLLAAEEVAS